MFTTRHYKVIAEVVADRSLHLQDSKRRALADRFAVKFKADNDRFDATRFYAACDLELVDES
jgi:hypothetical protein